MNTYRYAKWLANIVLLPAITVGLLIAALANEPEQALLDEDDDEPPYFPDYMAGELEVDPDAYTDVVIPHHDRLAAGYAWN